MNRKLLFAAGLAVLMLSGQAVFAAAGISVKAGTLGFGADLTVGLMDKLNVRIGGNFLNLDVKKEDISSRVKEISMALDLKSTALLLDWHPTGGGFRITGGGMLNNNRLALSAIPNTTVKIYDQDFAVNSLDGEITFPKTAPYLGIGYGNAGKEDKDSHWRFAFDLGVMFQGSAEATLTGTASDPNIQSILNAAIDHEIKDKKEDVKAFNIYPVLSFGFSYVF